MDSDVQRPFLSREDTDDAEEHINNRQSFKYVRPVERRSFLKTVKQNITDHFKFVGAGIIAAVSYFDPGNWGTDLAAGSQYGYSLLGVVLLASLGAILYQILSCRLGIVTGLDLAQHIRLQLHNREKNPMIWRWMVLYPLYVLAEFSLVATDLSELLGSAIALNLIFPFMPLWVGVSLTALDVLIILAMYNPSGSSRSMHIFEGIIGVMTIAVFASFAVLVIKVHPEWSEVMRGFLPNKLAFEPGATYISIGIIGATIMPHSMFLGSKLATADRLASASSVNSSRTSSNEDRFSLSNIEETSRNPLEYVAKAMKQDPDYEPSPRIGDADVYEGGPGRLPSILKHLKHGSWDIALSLLTIAVPVNAAILIVASATFFNNPNRDSEGVADLFDAHDLILKYIGKPFAFIFAFALLCAGQSASITATQASQAVSEGFINWKSPPILRRLITRLLGILPSLIIAVIAGRSGVDQLLNASQVVLSIMLPFAIGPLIYLSGREDVMRVWNPTDEGQSTSTTNLLDPSRLGPSHAHRRRQSENVTIDGGYQQFQLADQLQLNTTGQWVDLRPPKYILIISWIIFVGLCLSNGFVVVQVCRGKEI
ncbi:Nramp-domain-containing protein [Wallemia mellicola]|uniref:Nramp-domain-containing protein n=1 Tax=Wallemia mellicola TaxID=1708541 RepID=A0A4T0P4L1_9BASI|nr:Nramp-domain-containing protein [Wallemia mellicola]